jgi:hypothetical protein
VAHNPSCASQRERSRTAKDCSGQHQEGRASAPRPPQGTSWWGLLKFAVNQWLAREI